MNLSRAALRRPITVLVVMAGLVLAAVLSLRRMAIDIFPDMGVPVIYVAQPYGGMDPAQMEGSSPITTSITSCTSPASSTSSRRTSRARP